MVTDLKEFFPTWESFCNEHNEHNLAKLCIEMKEFEAAVYATLQSEREKEIFVKNKNVFV